MNLPRIKKPQKNIRDIINDDRAIKKAAKDSMRMQKKITTKAAKLRAQTAQ